MSSPTILLVDKDAAQRQLIDMLLTEDGYHIVGVETGRQATEFLRANTPSLAILDLELPDSSGASICERIKAIPRLARVPVILTAKPSKDSGSGLCARTRELARLVRADLLIPKPLGDKNLRVRVRELLAVSGARPPDPILEPRSSGGPDDAVITLGQPGVETELKLAGLPEDHEVAVTEPQRENDHLNSRIERLVGIKDELESALAEQRAQVEALRGQLDTAMGEAGTHSRGWADTGEPESDRIDGGPTDGPDLEALVDSQAREIEGLTKRNRLLVEVIEKEKRRNEISRGRLFNLNK